MELIPLVGAGASLSQLREVGTSLRNGFALQRLIEGRWTVTGYVGTEARAVDWVVNGNPAY